MTDLTLSDLQRVTHVKRRSLQEWAKSGLLKAHASTEGKGTGIHRQFPASAVETVRLLALLHDLGVDNNHKEDLFRIVSADPALRSALERAREALKS